LNPPEGRLKTAPTKRCVPRAQSEFKVFAVKTGKALHRIDAMVLDFRLLHSFYRVSA